MWSKEGRGTRIKSKLDPTSHNREKTWGWETLFDSRYEIDRWVWCGAKGHTMVQFGQGKWQRWVYWILVDMSNNTDNISSLLHNLIVHNVYAGFTQGLGFPPLSLINCCRAQGRSREVLPEELQNNWRPLTLYIRTLTTGCVHIFVQGWQFSDFILTSAGPQDHKRCFWTHYLRSWPFPYWKVLKICTKSHSSHDLYQNLQKTTLILYGPCRGPCKLIHTWSQNDPLCTSVLVVSD